MGGEVVKNTQPQWLSSSTTLCNDGRSGFSSPVDSYMPEHLGETNSFPVGFNKNWLSILWCAFGNTY